MVDTAPKISFIPKASLVREENALRARPRSAFMVIVSIIFIVSVGLYLGLFLYHRALANDVNNVTSAIERLQKDFDRPGINDARVFRARADFARELLSQHVTMRPLFTFLERYTVEKIFYTSFSFKRDGIEGPLLELKGEAPDYASLAYQMDTFRNRIDTLHDWKELKTISIQEMNLTSVGTVAFSLSLIFIPDFLSYAGYVTKEESFSGEQITIPSAGGFIATSAPLVTDASTTTMSKDDTKEWVRNDVACELPLVRMVKEDGTVMCVDNGTSQSTTTETLKSFWTWLKF